MAIATPLGSWSRVGRGRRPNGRRRARPRSARWSCLGHVSCEPLRAEQASSRSVARPPPPRARAACPPARVRSRIGSRANPAKLPPGCNTSRPAGVVVPIASSNGRPGGERTDGDRSDSDHRTGNRRPRRRESRLALGGSCFRRCETRHRPRSVHPGEAIGDSVSSLRTARGHRRAIPAGLLRS